MIEMTVPPTVDLHQVSSSSDTYLSLRDLDIARVLWVAIIIGYSIRMEV